MRDQGRRDRVLARTEQPGLHGVHAIDLGAVGQLRAGIDRGPLAPFLEQADGVVALEDHAIGIDAAVAVGARRVLTMRFESLAQGQIRLLRRGRVERRHVGRRRRRFLAEDARLEPHRAFDRMGLRAVGAPAQEGALAGSCRGPALW